MILDKFFYNFINIKKEKRNVSAFVIYFSYSIKSILILNILKEDNYLTEKLDSPTLLF